MNQINQQVLMTLSTEVPEDVMTLRHTYSLSKLSYVDISKMEQLTEMMKRWTLLEELAQLNNTVHHEKQE